MVRNKGGNNKQRQQNKGQHQNKQGNKQGNKGNRNQGPRKGQPQARGVFAPREILEGPRLRKAVQQVVNYQTRPAMRQANRAIHDITAEREKDIGREQNLGKQAGRNIADYYTKLAADAQEKMQGVAVANQQAQGAIAQSGRETLAGIQAAGQADTSGIGGYTGGDISSRDQLANMIAQYGSTAANNANALNAEAASTGQSWAGLLASQSLAGQQRGGEILGDTRRQVLGQIGTLKREYGQNIKKARDAYNELILQRPELAGKALNELRESERNFILSKAALGIEKGELGLKNKQLKAEKEGKTGGIAYSNVNTRNQIKYLKIKTREQEAKRLKEIEALGASQQEIEAEKRRFRNHELKRTEEIQNNAKNGGGAGGYQPFGKTYSYLRSSGLSRNDLVMGFTDPKSGRHYTPKEVRRKAYDKLRNFGATDKTARKVIKKYVKGSKYIKASKDPSPGRDIVNGRHTTGR